MNPFLQEYQARSQVNLDAALSNSDTPEKLQAAMRYSALAGGKRIRALLVYAAGFAVQAPLARLDAVAAALECIHCYSLIHDDLPAMDDDTLRRGQATSHIQFDEATAILAGDALHTLAFELICNERSQLNDQQSRAISLKLAICAGQTGMIGGQMLDILATEQNLDRQQLENVHRRKTGALICAAVICGGLCGDDVAPEMLAVMDKFANNIGLAFQVMDDVLDVESSTKILGKSSGADARLGKSTYPAIIGLAASKDLALNLYQQAIESVAPIGDNSAHLVDLATFVINRNH